MNDLIDAYELLKENVDYLEVCGHDTGKVQLPRGVFNEVIAILEDELCPDNIEELE